MGMGKGMGTGEEGALISVRKTIKALFIIKIIYFYSPSLKNDTTFLQGTNPLSPRGPVKVLQYPAISFRGTKPHKNMLLLTQFKSR